VLIEARDRGVVEGVGGGANEPDVEYDLDGDEVRVLAGYVDDKEAFDGVG